MRVKLCERCPYLPSDIAGHHDPEAEAHLCCGCDERVVAVNHYPRAKRWSIQARLRAQREASVRLRAIERERTTLYDGRNYPL